MSAHDRMSEDQYGAQQPQQISTDTNEALRESQQQLAAIAANIPGAVFRLIFHRDGRVSLPYISAGMQEISGLEVALQAKVNPEYLFEMIHPDDRNSVKEQLKISIETLRDFQQEYRIISTSGEVKWVQGNAGFLRMENGDVVMDGVAIDITDRKQAEAALRNSQIFIQKIADATPQILSLYDISEGIAIYLNRQILEILGYSPEELYESGNQWLLDKLHPDDRSLVENIYNRFANLADKQVLSSEYRLRHKNGEWRWLNSREVIFTRDDNGAPKLILGSVQDITDRKKAEDALRESEARFRLVADSAPVFLWMSDTEGMRTFVNQSWLSFTGRTIEEEIGEGWAKNVHPEDLQRCLDTYFSAVNTRQYFQIEYRLRRVDGEYSWVLDKGVPRFLPDGSFAGYIGSCVDISDRFLAEETLRQQAQREQLLRTITQRIHESLDLDRILTTTVTSVRQTLQADRAIIFRLSANGSGVIIKEAVLPEYPATVEMTWPDECFPSECYEYYRQGKWRIVPDVKTDEWGGCITDFMQQIGVKSKIVAPITQKAEDSYTRVWGLLIVHACSYRRQWQADEAELLQQISNQLAIAIQQANLYNELQIELAERKVAELSLRRAMIRERFIATLAQHIRQSLDLSQMLNTTVAEVRQFLEVDRVIIYRFHPDWSGKVIAESVEDESFSIINRVINDPCFGKSMAHLYGQGRIHNISDIFTANLEPCYLKLLAQLQVRSILVIPIIVKETLWGLLVAHHCTGPRQWQHVNWNLLQQLSAHLAIGIHQAELYQQTQQQAQRQRSLNRVIQAIRNSLDLDTIFTTAVSEIGNLLQVDSVSIVQYLPEEKVWLTVANYSQISDLQSTLGIEIPDEGNPLAAQLKQLKIVRIDNTSEISDPINKNIPHMRYGAWLLIPLHNQSSIWGSLSLLKRQQPYQWQDFEVELADEVADQLAIAIQQSQLYHQLQAANEELQRQARIDSLTQIANRRRFDEYLNFEWLRLRREQAPLSLILFDVDYFKRYNDTYGHQAGDDCLRHLGGAMKKVVRRPADLVARYGGEEFAVILPHTDVNGAVYIAQAIRQAIQKLAIPHARSDISEYLTVSLGVCCIVPNLESSPQDLIDAADRALYTAKEQGRDRVACA